MASAAPPPESSAKLERFNPNHYGPGERGGQFAPKDEGDAGSSSTSAPPKPVQVAGGNEPNEEGGRGRGPIEEEFDPTAPIRQEFYNAASARLRAIDPSNQALQSLRSPDWIPSKEDVNNMQATLNRAIEEQAANAAEHGYEEHIGEFRDIHSQIELQLRVQDVIRNSIPEIARDGRTFFYQKSTNTVVIVNTVRPEDSTVFRPTDGRKFVDQNLEEVTQ